MEGKSRTAKNVRKSGKVKTVFPASIPDF